MKYVQPLQRWLTLQFALAASVPLATVALLVWLMLLPQMRTEIGIRHQALARSIAGQVTTHLLGAERELRALAGYIDLLGKQWPNFWFTLLDSHAGTGDVFEKQEIRVGNLVVCVGAQRGVKPKYDQVVAFELF